MRWIAFAALLAVGFSVSAESARVIKAGGKRALIEFPGNTFLKPGQTINIGGNGESTTIRSGPAGRRENIIGGAARVSSIRTSGGGTKASTTTRIAATGQYGWNKRQYEYGPQLTFAYTSAGGSNTTAASAGVFLDYNIIPNDPGVDFVWGLGGSFDIGFSNGSGSSSNTMELFAGVNAKWFPIKLPVAFRADAGLDFTRNAADKAVNGFGFLARGGFLIYF